MDQAKACLSSSGLCCPLRDPTEAL